MKTEAKLYAAEALAECVKLPPGQREDRLRDLICDMPDRCVDAIRILDPIHREWVHKSTQEAIRNKERVTSLLIVIMALANIINALFMFYHFSKR